jgi:hypothetical protein
VLALHLHAMARAEAQDEAAMRERVHRGRGHGDGGHAAQNTLLMLVPRRMRVVAVAQAARMAN